MDDLDVLSERARNLGTLAKEASQSGNSTEMRKINWLWNAFMKNAHAEFYLEHTEKGTTFGELLDGAMKIEETLTAAYANAYLGRE
jgi:hypothetical protein